MEGRAWKSREVCPAENILCLTGTLNVIVSVWSANICENVSSVVLVFQKDHSLFITSLTALVQVTTMSLLMLKIKASCLTCRCLYSDMQ